MALKYSEKPPYDQLRFLLTKNLLDKDMFPDNQFDWIIKQNLGEFELINDLYLNIHGLDAKKHQVKLSERMLKLNMSNHFLENYI